MVKIQKVFDDSGFVFSEHRNSFQKNIFEEITVGFEPENGDWASDDLDVYVHHPKFGFFMERVFKKQIHAKTGLPVRKLRNDKLGLISTSLLGRSVTKGEIAILSGGKTMLLKTYLEALDTINSCVELSDHLFSEKYGSIQVPIEGIWVYLFLRFEQGFGTDRIVFEVARDLRVTRLHHYCKTTRLSIESLSIIKEVYLDSLALFDRHPSVIRPK